MDTSQRELDAMFFRDVEEFNVDDSVSGIEEIDCVAPDGGFSALDVLFGKSHICTQNGGTLKLKSILIDRLFEYERAPLKLGHGEEGKSKPDINREILEAIKVTGGRFRKKNATNGLWVEVSDKAAVDKIVGDFKTLRKKVWTPSRRDPGAVQVTESDLSPEEEDQKPAAAPKNESSMRSLSRCGGRKKDSGSRSSGDPELSWTIPLSIEDESLSHEKEIRRCISDSPPVLGFTFPTETKSSNEGTVSHHRPTSPVQANKKTLSKSGGHVWARVKVHPLPSHLLSAADQQYRSDVSSLSSASEKKSFNRTKRSPSENDMLPEQDRHDLQTVPEENRSDGSRVQRSCGSQNGFSKMDVLFGDTELCSRHFGNVKLHSILTDQLLEYDAAPQNSTDGQQRRSKSEIIKAIVETIKREGGVFQEEDAVTGRWEEANASTTVKKIAELFQALRIKVRPKRAESATAGGVVTLDGGKGENDGKVSSASGSLQATTFKSHGGNEEGIISTPSPDSEREDDFISVPSEASSLSFDELSWESFKSDQKIPPSSAGREYMPKQVGHDQERSMAFIHSNKRKSDGKGHHRTLVDVEPSTSSALLADAGAAAVLEHSNRQDQRTASQKPEHQETMDGNESCRHVMLPDTSCDCSYVASRAVALMKESPKDMEIQIEGMNALCGLLTENVLSRRIIAAAGGIDVVLHAMKVHATKDEVQNMACLLVGNLATNNPENRAAIAVGRGIEAVVSAIRGNAGHAALQLNGCYALGSLAENSVENQATISAVGGVELIIDMMKEHPMSQIVGATGANTIGNIAFQNQENQLSVAALGGIQAILEVMRGHSCVGYVQQYCLSALGRLVADCPNIVAILVTSNGILDVLKAMYEFSSHPLILENACIAFGHIARSGDEYRSKLIELGAHALIQEAHLQYASGNKEWALAQLMGSKRTRH